MTKDFEQLYLQYAGTVRRFILSLGASDALADDITSDTFLKALLRIDTFDETKSMLTWLCTIAKNTYVDHLRKREHGNVSLDALPPVSPDAATPLGEVLQAEQNQVLYKGIMQLPEPYKDVIYLRMFAELSFRDIGTLFGRNENWARVTFYRGKLKLKELIQDEI